ncbi:ParB N-terminal domain-containing protein [Leucobacter aridicollis]|uniref:ParB-like chromosome segregation protein Spo0J n=1 Tax=Leucobacter aridicollis TaxID=283878 RepID=A0A852R8U9_9MICO|nr:ParB/RepB/Spo0J family partition protein [Leucobacter aridicollis]MBL3681160.1 ParB/RepB/Spo0J family partition protein [Leucobacter aridicollis]NYD27825.1 ParB-like chromosome segregation protein Spo0J [Leucobacter aridicollis]
MNDGIIQTPIQQDWKLVRVEDVIVKERLRDYDEDHINRIRRSFRELGGQLQLQPIVLDERMILIDGAHRLEAASREGWEFISALIWTGVTEEDRPILEAEANIVRKDFSPVELERIWKEHYEPATRAKARKTQVKNLRRGDDFPVTGNTGNGEIVAVSKVARETVGRDIDWLNKVTDVRALAESTTAPVELRAAAERGIEKLSKPGAKVDPVHKELLRLQDAFSKKGQAPTERRAEALEKTLDKQVTESTLLAEKYSGELGSDLVEAAGVVPAGGESVRAIRVALTHALAGAIIVECRTSENPAAALRPIGQEVVDLLNMLTTKQLGLEA